MEAAGYAQTWKQADDLDALNRRIHDGVAVDQLADRARGYVNTMFDVLYPMAQPKPGAQVVEFGSGVGWIMQAMLERFPQIQVTGLDISENMVARAKERFSDPRAKFVLYDGFNFPFADGSIDVLYSCAAIQHVEKHIAFLLFEEMHRVLKPQGHAVLHVLSVRDIPNSGVAFEQECWNHINNAPEHWLHYYSFDELLVLFGNLIKVDELDIRHYPNLNNFYIHFSKDTGRRFARPDLPRLGYTGAGHAAEGISGPALRNALAHSRVAPVLRPVYRAGRRALNYVRAFMHSREGGQPAQL